MMCYDGSRFYRRFGLAYPPLPVHTNNRAVGFNVNNTSHKRYFCDRIVLYRLGTSDRLDALALSHMGQTHKKLYSDVLAGDTQTWRLHLNKISSTWGPERKKIQGIRAITRGSFMGNDFWPSSRYTAYEFLCTMLLGCFETEPIQELTYIGGTHVCVGVGGDPWNFILVTPQWECSSLNINWLMYCVINWYRSGW